MTQLKGKLYAILVLGQSEAFEGPRKWGPRHFVSQSVCLPYLYPEELEVDFNFDMFFPPHYYLLRIVGTITATLLLLYALSRVNTSTSKKITMVYFKTAAAALVALSSTLA